MGLGSHRVNCSSRLWGGGRGEKAGSRFFTNHCSTGTVTLSIDNYVVLNSNGWAFERGQKIFYSLKAPSACDVALVPRLRGLARPFGNAQGRPTTARKRKSGRFARDDRKGGSAPPCCLLVLTPGLNLTCCPGPSTPWPTFAQRERQRKSATPVGMTELCARIRAIF
jgi:hypothetical protein